MKDIIIFGNGKIADVIQYYMREESQLPVKAFCVDQEYLSDDYFNGLPVIPFESIEEQYPPEQYDFFVAMGYHDLNAVRAKKMLEIEEKGYQLISYIHPNSMVPNDLRYGKNCFIMNNVNIHPRVTIGDNVFVWSGAMIGHHSTIGNHNWFTSSTNIGGNVTVGDYCFFAMNATVGHSVSIGTNCFLGANVLVTKNYGDDSVWVEANTKKFRLNSHDFIKFSNFGNL